MYKTRPEGRGFRSHGYLLTKHNTLNELWPLAVHCFDLVLGYLIPLYAGERSKGLGGCCRCCYLAVVASLGMKRNWTAVKTTVIGEAVGRKSAMARRIGGVGLRHWYC